MVDCLRRAVSERNSAKGSPAPIDAAAAADDDDDDDDVDDGGGDDKEESEEVLASISP